MKQSTKNILGIAMLILGIVIIPTISELVIAGINRYQVYPLGTDTNMYSKITLVGGILSLFLSVLLIWKFLKIDKLKRWVLLPILAFAMLWATHFVPSFVPNSWCKFELKIYSCESLNQDPSFKVYI